MILKLRFKNQEKKQTNGIFYIFYESIENIKALTQIFLKFIVHYTSYILRDLDDHK